jgi:hypothetical protein
MRGVLLLASVLILTACEKPVMPLPGTTGKAGELVIVMEEGYWDSRVGDSVYAAVTEPMYGLPQVEPLFDGVHIGTRAFTRIFQTHRNILLCTIDSAADASIEVRADVWSAPQLVIEITAPDTVAFMRVFHKNRSRIIDQFIGKEEERNRNSYGKQLAGEVADALAEDFGISLPVPKGFNVVSRKDSVIWLRYDTKDINQSLLIYTEPYTRQNTFTKEGMLEMIDRVGRAHVPGPSAGSYMRTFGEYPPRFTETSIGKLYATELRGLWYVEGDIMGGPFLCYAFLDEPRNRVVYLHGFVFAPAVDKRNLMVQLRSIIHGLEVL